METEDAINFLVEHAAKVDSEFAGIRSTMATRQDVTALAELVREETKAMRHYTTYVESMLNVVN